MKSEAVVAILASEGLAQVAVSYQHARRSFVPPCTVRYAFHFEREIECLLITESPKTPGHYRYLIWVLYRRAWRQRAWR